MESQFALAHQRNTIPIDDDIGAACAAPLGCSVQTGVGAVLNALAPNPGQSLVALRPRGRLGIVGLGGPTADLLVGLIRGKGLRIRGVGRQTGVDDAALTVAPVFETPVFEKRVRLCWSYA
jgi:Zn-dependent alcohol dehydrogenase